MRVEVSLGFVLSLRPKRAAFGQAGSTRLDSHKYLGRHIPGNLKQRGCVDLNHRTIVANKHVSFKLRLKLFNAVVTTAMLFSLHTFALTKLEF